MEVVSDNKIEQHATARTKIGYVDTLSVDPLVSGTPHGSRRQHDRVRASRGQGCARGGSRRGSLAESPLPRDHSQARASAVGSRGGGAPPPPGSAGAGPGG